MDNIGLEAADWWWHQQKLDQEEREERARELLDKYFGECNGRTEENFGDC